MLLKTLLRPALGGLRILLRLLPRPRPPSAAVSGSTDSLPLGSLLCASASISGSACACASPPPKTRRMLDPDSERRMRPLPNRFIPVLGGGLLLLLLFAKGVSSPSSMLPRTSMPIPAYPLSPSPSPPTHLMLAAPVIVVIVLFEAERPIPFPDGERWMPPTPAPPNRFSPALGGGLRAFAFVGVTLAVEGAGGGGIISAEGTWRGAGDGEGERICTPTLSP